MATPLQEFVAQPNLVLLDVRTPEEFAEGHVPNSVNIPHETLEENVDKLPADKLTPIVCYCAHGRRGGIAEGFLKDKGYVNVLNGISFGSVGEAVAKK